VVRFDPPIHGDALHDAFERDRDAAN